MARPTELARLRSDLRMYFRLARLEQRHAAALRASGAPEWLAVEHDERRRSLLRISERAYQRLQELDPP